MVEPASVKVLRDEQNRLRIFINDVRRLGLDHNLRHENGGDDEISLEGLSGEPADTVNKSLFDAHTIIYAVVDDTPLALVVAASRIIGRKSSGNIGALTGAEILAILTGQADAAFDWNAQDIFNISGLGFTSGTELTISSGEVTATQGHHSIDTEGDAPTDDLDTINGLDNNKLLLIFAANGDRTVRVRNGEGNIFLRHLNETKSYNFNSPTGASGIDYVGGNYFFPATEAALTNVGATVTIGSANGSYAAHVVVVAKGDGVTDGSDLVLTVTGASIDDEGNYNGSDSEVIVADALLATFATNTMMETTKKWVGQATITLSSSGGGTFNCSFNYGYAKYEDFGNQAFTTNIFEAVGEAGASDSGFNLRLLRHSTADWTYHATAFVPGAAIGSGSELANMNTDHSTNKNLVSGHPINYKRVNLNTDIDGDSGEGIIVEITTGANRAIEHLDLHVGVHTIPKYLYLAAATQHALFMKHGSDFHQV